MKDKELLKSHEFIKLCGITKNTLIWYEKKGLIKPAYISENGYRYYSYKQFFNIDFVKNLKWTGKTLDEIQQYATCKDYESFINLLFEQKIILEQKLKKMVQQYTMVENTLEDCYCMKAEFTETPACVQYPQRYLLTHPISGDGEREYLLALKQIFTLFRQLNDTPSMQNGTIIKLEDSGSYRKTHVYLHVRTERAGTSYRLLPKGKYVICFYNDSCCTFEECYQRIRQYMTEHALYPIGDIYEREYINYMQAASSSQYYKQILQQVNHRSSHC